MRSNISLAAQILQELYQSVPIPELCKKLRAGEDISRFSPDQLSELLEDAIQRAGMLGYASQKKNRPQICHDISAFIETLPDCGGQPANSADFFQVLRYFSDCIIQRRQEKYLFDYRFTDIWRDYTRYVDEDMVVCAAVYTDDMRRRYDRRVYDWPICAEHNNHELRSILQRGMAENHFHLRGSSPFFYVSWVYLVNDLIAPDIENSLHEMEKSRLNKTLGNVLDYSLSRMRCMAAAIRIYLFARIHNYPIITDDLFLPVDTVRNDLEQFGTCPELDAELHSPNRRISLKRAEQGYMRSKQAYERFIRHTHACSYTWLMSYLNDENPAYQNQYQIQHVINQLRIRYGNRHVQDYANNVGADCKYSSFAGERAIEYGSLRMIFRHDTEWQQHKNLFFLYILIKQRFHMELVQTNNRSGFYNFMDYQNRKDYFIKWSPETEQSLAADAITSVLESSTVKSVELRITVPPDEEYGTTDLECYLKAIEKAKNALKSSDTHSGSENCRFHFTYHFIKQPYRPDNSCGFRQQQFREDIYRRAQVLMDIRRNYPKYRKYMLGIDACNEEMDCRPEVFAVAFRLLQYYEKRNHEVRSMQLQTTYHVGEDNYDLLDALRAIDEAVLFLELHPGSRLGHATLLGVEPQNYYQSRFRNEISLPKEVFLDNIVWMKMYLQNLNIQVPEHSALMLFIDTQFQKLFFEIYGQALQTLDIILDDMTGVSFTAKDLTADYYSAWLLRGDDPALYRNPLHFPIVLTDSEEYRICKTIPEIGRARKNVNAKILYHLYHYSHKVKAEGAKSYKLRIPPCYTNAVAIIQQHMQMRLAHQGIAIETNPSSNVFIGPVGSFGEHPISAFYDNKLSSECRDVQMNVSINTDDKSLFSTCLPNEYAYLAYALEQETDKDGNKKYKHVDIFQWIDDIRIMGLEQSFSCTDVQEETTLHTD